MARPGPPAKCRATTSGARRVRLAAGTRRMVFSGAPATLLVDAPVGQSARAVWGVGAGAAALLAPAVVAVFEEPQAARAVAQRARAMNGRRMADPDWPNGRGGTATRAPGAADRGRAGRGLYGARDAPRGRARGVCAEAATFARMPSVCRLRDHEPARMT